MSTTSISDKARMAKRHIRSVQEGKDEEAKKLQSDLNYVTLAKLRCAGECCRTCAFHQRVQFKFKCTRKKKFIQLENICHLHSTSSKFSGEEND